MAPTRLPGSPGWQRSASLRAPLYPAGADGVGETVDDDGRDHGYGCHVEDELAVLDLGFQDEQREQHRGDSLRAEPGDEEALRSRQPRADEREQDSGGSRDEDHEDDEGGERECVAVEA